MYTIFYGSSSSGKTFLAKVAEREYVCEHIEGDDFIHKELKEGIITWKVQDVDIDIFHHNLRNLINGKTSNSEPFVLTQAFPLLAYRNRLSSWFPELKFVCIKADLKTMLSRTKNRGDWVNEFTTKKVDELFQYNQGAYEIVNNGNYVPIGLYNILDEIGYERRN